MRKTEETASLQRLLSRLLVCVLLLASMACGKKEPPRLAVHEKPPVPSALKAIHREGELLLSWKYPEYAALEGFVLMKAADGEFERIAMTKKPAYLDRDFMPGQSYRYRVLARDLRGLLSEASEEITVSPVQAPPPPEDISYEISRNSIRLSWGHPSHDVLFNVYKTKKEGQYPLTPANPEPLKEPSFTNGIDPSQEVFYTVRALRGGPLRDEGPPSEEVSIGPGDYLPSRPVGLKAVVLEDRVVLVWEENPETWVRGYRLYRAVEGGEFEGVGTAQTPTYTDMERPEGKVFYKVSAMGPVNEGPPSETLEVGSR